MLKYFYLTLYYFILAYFLFPFFLFSFLYLLFIFLFSFFFVSNKNDFDTLYKKYILQFFQQFRQYAI